MKPTYEEFRELVKKNFMHDMKGLSDEDVETYLSEDDSVDVIKNEYECSSGKFDRGEITEKMFRNGSVSAASYSLYMLY